MYDNDLDQRGGVRDSQNTGVSTIILTYNEASNIETCLTYLNWSDDVIIVDSYSEDNTIAVAKKTRPDIRVFKNTFEDFGQQRNWALDNTSPRYEWVLFIDADEQCTPELAEEIMEFVRSPGDAVGAYIAGKNYFLGRWLKHCTFYPSWQLRLLKRGYVRFRKEGHGQREVTDGHLIHLSASWNHFGFSKGIENWIARHNRYSSEEVELVLRLRNEPLRWREILTRDPIIRRRMLKRLAAKLPCLPLTRFLYTYFLRGGFLDGYPGLMFCLLNLSHDIHILAKLCEKQYEKRTDNVNTL